MHVGMSGYKCVVALFCVSRAIAMVIGGGQVWVSEWKEDIRTWIRARTTWYG